MTYADFLLSKTHAADQHGFAPLWLPDCLFPFQKALVEWAIRKGRSAIFADCGLGKTLMELVWCSNMLRKENKPVLILTPLAVGPQMVREGEKFGIACQQVRKGKFHKGINITNYEQLLHYNPADFCAVAADESQAIKHSDSKTRHRVTDFLNKIKYRLLATATPSPNDYMELGTSSEALGAMGRSQMLGMFFTNSGETTQQWELKGHARRRFWRWVSSWARALRKPSDLGFNDDGYNLPPLEIRQHVVDSDNIECNGTFRFAHVAKTLDEQRKERRATLRERCEKIAELAPKDDYYLVYCHLNPEGELLEELIPDSVNVQGSDSDEKKEEMLAAFAIGQIKRLVTKPKIGGYGLNFQHCCCIGAFPSFSFEQWYQLVRRCWRFGQKRNVVVDMVTAQGEGRVVEAMRRKERQMEEMFDGLVAEMGEWQTGKKNDKHMEEMRLPTWLSK